MPERELTHDFSCEQLLTSIGDYIEGDLSPDLCQEIERHLAICEHCRIIVDTLNKTITLYHTSAHEAEVPNGVRDRLFHVLKLDNEDNKRT